MECFGLFSQVTIQQANRASNKHANRVVAIAYRLSNCQHSPSRNQPANRTFRCDSSLATCQTSCLIAYSVVGVFRSVWPRYNSAGQSRCEQTRQSFPWHCFHCVKLSAFPMPFPTCQSCFRGDSPLATCQMSTMSVERFRLLGQVKIPQFNRATNKQHTGVLGIVSHLSNCQHYPSRIQYSTRQSCFRAD